MIASPTFFSIKSSFELEQIDIRYPAIIKPVDSGGSQGVNKVNNLQELKEAYKELCKSAMEQGQMMDNAIFVRSFLDSKFKRIPYVETYIGEFAENHPVGKYLITTNGHITACINGYIIDTWDCTDKKIEYIWKIL